MPHAVDLFVDTDFAECKETRRSTSGGAIMVGQGLIKHWAKTQTTISLSSGESELHGIASGCAQALGVQSLMHNMGWIMPTTVHSAATAAIGTARQKGLGKIRHLDLTDLWIQDKIRSKQIILLKVLGTDNVADVFTKYVDPSTLERALKTFMLSGSKGDLPARQLQWASECPRPTMFYRVYTAHRSSWRPDEFQIPQF